MLFRSGIMTILERDNSAPSGAHCSAHWIVKCDCGNVRSISANVLRSLHQQSCGCLRGFGGRIEATYKAPKQAQQRWMNMMKRCYRPANAKDRKNYMDRGITVCERWHDRDVFYADMGDPPFVGASIDRINNDGNYEPSNCRWATCSQQNLNRGLYNIANREEAYVL